MVEVVENSQDEIFNINEEAKEKYSQIEKELAETRKQVFNQITKNDELKQKVQYLNNNKQK